jgi:hypothetical protein
MPRSTVYRVTGLPQNKAAAELKLDLECLLTESERQNLEVKVDCIPACDGRPAGSALVGFKGGNPSFLSALKDSPLATWQVEVGEDDINFDCHFHGFTQLYPTAVGQPVTAE